MLPPLPPPPLLPPLPGRHACACVDRQPTYEPLIARPPVHRPAWPERRRVAERVLDTSRSRPPVRLPRRAFRSARSANQLQLPACSAAGPRADAAASPPLAAAPGRVGMTAGCGDIVKLNVGGRQARNLLSALSIPRALHGRAAATAAAAAAPSPSAKHVRGPSLPSSAACRAGCLSPPAPR